MKSRLRMQSFMIIGQGVPKIQGVTDKQTQVGDLLYRYEVLKIGLEEIEKLQKDPN